MADKISFDLVSPERLLLSAKADMVTVPGTEGYMGVMAGHSPLVSTLRAGMIDVQVDGKDDRYFIRGGFAEISPTKITVMAEEAVPRSDACRLPGGAGTAPGTNNASCRNCRPFSGRS